MALGGSRGKSIPIVFGTAEDMDLREQASGQSFDTTKVMKKARGLRVPKVRIARPPASILRDARVATDTTLILEDLPGFAHELPTATTMYLTGISGNTVKAGDTSRIWKGTLAANGTFTITDTYVLREVFTALAEAGASGVNEVVAPRSMLRTPGTNYSANSSIMLWRLGPIARNGGGGDPGGGGSTAYDVVLVRSIVSFTASVTYSTSNHQYDGVSCNKYGHAAAITSIKEGDLVAILTPSGSAQIGQALDAGTVIMRIDDKICGRFAVNLLPSYRVSVAESNDEAAILFANGANMGTGDRSLPEPRGIKTTQCPVPCWPIPKDDGFQDRSRVNHNMATVLVPFHPTTAMQMAFLVEGIDDSGAGTGALVENVADVIKEILQNTALGGVPASQIDATSFTNARSLAAGIDLGFVLEEPHSLLELVGDLAFQGGVYVYHDDGQFHATRLDNKIEAADSIYTVTSDAATTAYIRDSIVVQQQSVEEVVTEVQVSQQEEGKGVDSARSTAAESMRGGPQVVDLDLWAIQKQNMRIDVARFYLARWSDLYERITLVTGLRACKVREGDVITLTVTAQDGGSLYSSTPVRVTQVTDRIGENLLEFACERILIDNSVDDTEIYGYTYYLNPSWWT